MVNYLLTVEAGKLVFKKGTSTSEPIEPDYLPFDPRITPVTPTEIKNDQKYINFLDCIKDGTNENTLLLLDLFLNNGLQYGFAQSLASYESNILKNRKAFLEPHSWSNLKQNKIKGKRSSVQKTTYDEPFEMVNVVWDCGLSPACYTQNSTSKNKLPSLRATFGSFIDPLCKINSSDFGQAISYPPLNKSPGAVTVEINNSAMNYFGFGNSSIKNIIPKSSGKWGFDIDIKIGEGCTGKGCKITEKDSKYLKGNNIKSVILKSKTSAKEKVKYVVLKEFGDKMQVLCFIMMFIEEIKSLMNTCDMVVFALCLFLKLPCVFAGNHKEIDTMFGASDYKKYRIIKYSAKKESELETYKNLYDTTKNSVLANNNNKIDFIKVIIAKIKATGQFHVNDGNLSYNPPAIIFVTILFEFENINRNLQNYLDIKEAEIKGLVRDPPTQKILIYQEVINSIKPLYEIVSIFRAKSNIDDLKLIQTLKKFTVRGNTTKPYFGLWLKDDSVRNQKQHQGTAFRMLSAKSSIGDIVRACSPQAVGGGKIWHGGAAAAPVRRAWRTAAADEQKDDELEDDELAEMPVNSELLGEFVNIDAWQDSELVTKDPPSEGEYDNIITWAVLWIEDIEQIDEHDEHDENVNIDNLKVYIDSDKYWEDKGEGVLSIQYSTADYEGIETILISNKLELSNTGNSLIPPSIVSAPVYYYFNSEENPQILNKDGMNTFFNTEIIDFLNNTQTQEFVLENKDTPITIPHQNPSSTLQTPPLPDTLGKLADSYIADRDDLDKANILLYNIQEIAYGQALNGAKKLWEDSSKEWEWNDDMAGPIKDEEGDEQFEYRKEEERKRHEETKEIEILSLFNSLKLPNFEPKEFFDTTTEYSLESILDNGITLYLKPQQYTGDELSAEHPPLLTLNEGEAEEAEEAEEEAEKYAEFIKTQVYSTLTTLAQISGLDAKEEAKRAAKEAYRAYRSGRRISVNYEGDIPEYVYENMPTDEERGGGPKIGGSNKEVINTKISKEEAYALYLIYSGSENSNVMPGIPLVNSPEEYQENNELFFKYMSEIINNTSISDSDHITPLINLKEEVKADDKSKIELAGEVKKNDETIETTKNQEKINLDSLIDSRMPLEASAAAAAAAGGKKRKKRKTKKKRKRNKKTISNSKYSSKKTKRKKRRKKKSLKN